MTVPAATALTDRMDLRRKLIETALPLSAINAAGAREKSIGRGHPSSLHLWWARRPLAAARAVIFAQMVDDPSEYVDVLLRDPQVRHRVRYVLRRDGSDPNDSALQRKKAIEEERERLFDILKQLVLWKSTTDEPVLSAARSEIWQSWRRACAMNADHPQADALFDRYRLPAFHDPFAGGGALPLEAQRLGLQAHASDLNPVAVLINKAMIEIPPRFAGRSPVNPASRSVPAVVEQMWQGAHGLAEDVRYYGQWVQENAQQRLDPLYPKVQITPAMARERPDLKPYQSRALTVIAWIWARTVKSPNPAFAEVDVPLTTTFMLSTKKGKEAYVEPVIEERGYRFTVKTGKPSERARRGTKSGRGGSPFLCLMSGSPMPFSYLRAEGKAGRMGSRLMAIVAQGTRGRVYLSPTAAHEAAAVCAKPEQVVDTDLPAKALGFSVQGYGMLQWRDLYTPRQLTALTAVSDLVTAAKQRVRRDAMASGLSDDARPLRRGGTGATAYAEAVALYLAFAADRLAMTGNTLVRWIPQRQTVAGCFGRQAVPMVWDYAEPNILGTTSGSVHAAIALTTGPLASALLLEIQGISEQADAMAGQAPLPRVISTDPPYYDNIGYADLSDFFYVWLRRSLKDVFPELFATLTVPKADELIASSHRHKDRKAAERFFLRGMEQALCALSEQAHPAFPVTIFYAFKQSETRGDAGTASTGWETFLEAVIQSGFAITGTWPMRTERGSRPRSIGSNALASSIILVCRQRPDNQPSATRRAFITALRSELPQALRLLQTGSIAPVDLAQSAIGPGMAVYTRYAKVLDAAGHALSVREALALINEILDEELAEQEDDLDADSRWALAWFTQHGFGEGDYGVAETLSKAKNTSIAGLVQAGILSSVKGRVRLLQPKELDESWSPATDKRLTVWETVHHLIQRHELHGETSAARLVASLGSRAEPARALCYRLFVLCDRKKRPAEALRYNALVQSWPEISRLARSAPAEQAGIFDNEV